MKETGSALIHLYRGGQQPENPLFDIRDLDLIDLTPSPGGLINKSVNGDCLSPTVHTAKDLRRAICVYPPTNEVFWMDIEGIDDLFVLLCTGHLTLPPDVQDPVLVKVLGRGSGLVKPAPSKNVHRGLHFVLTLCNRLLPTTLRTAVLTLVAEKFRSFAATNTTHPPAGIDGGSSSAPMDVDRSGREDRRDGSSASGPNDVHRSGRDDRRDSPSNDTVVPISNVIDALKTADQSAPDIDPEDELAVTARMDYLLAMHSTAGGSGLSLSALEELHSKVVFGACMLLYIGAAVKMRLPYQAAALAQIPTAPDRVAASSQSAHNTKTSNLAVDPLATRATATDHKAFRLQAFPQQVPLAVVGWIVAGTAITTWGLAKLFISR
ncbi:hypothetical protein C8F01DRAFT_294117 [Mycena amicta]|nr:hypothetical protein C8F01DRAFT_294117 [Mycena amicta]